MKKIEYILTYYSPKWGDMDNSEVLEIYEGALDKINELQEFKNIENPIHLIKYEYEIDSDRNVSNIFWKSLWKHEDDWSLEAAIDYEIKRLQELTEVSIPPPENIGGVEQGTKVGNQTVFMSNICVGLQVGDEDSVYIYQSDDIYQVQEIYHKCCRLIEAGVEISNTYGIDKQYYIKLPDLSILYVKYFDTKRWDDVENAFFKKPRQLEVQPGLFRAPEQNEVHNSEQIAFGKSFVKALDEAKTNTNMLNDEIPLSYEEKLSRVIQEVGKSINPKTEENSLTIKPEEPIIKKKGPWAGRLKISN